MSSNSGVKTLFIWEGEKSEVRCLKEGFLPLPIGSKIQLWGVDYTIIDTVLEIEDVTILIHYLNKV